MEANSNETVKMYPRYRMGKNIQVKMTPQMAIMECGYNHIVRAFGQPTFSIDGGDEFDGIEHYAWHIQFETGDRVRISDIRVFGGDETQNTINRWRVNTHKPATYEWVKQIIRDANPNQ
jgi:hypothetical protein